MNRRELLKLVGMGVAGLITQATSLKVLAVAAPSAEPAPDPVGPWKLYSWIEKEFDYGNKTGFCGIFKHEITGELARNAVLVNTPHYTIERPDLSKERAQARKILHDWINEVKADDANDFDEVLEGHERFRVNEGRVEVWGRDGEFIGWHDGSPWNGYSGYGGLEVEGQPVPDNWIWHSPKVDMRSDRLLRG